MVDASPVRWRDRVPWGFLGMLCLVIPVESYLRRHELENLTVEAEGYWFSARAAKREAPRARLLCLGDSQVKMGVLPSVLEERLGLPSYNLAINGGQPFASYLILRNALASGSRPEAILVDFKPSILVSDPRNATVEKSELLNLGDGMRLAWAVRDASFGCSLVLNKLLPSLRLREALRADVAARLKTGQPVDRQYPRAALLNWAYNKGTHVLPPDPDVRTRPKFWNEGDCLQLAWQCNLVNLKYVYRFLDLAADHDIPVYWLILPLYPRVRYQREELGLEESHDRFLRVILSGYPNVKVIDGRYSGFEEDAFVDASHLNRDGAQSYSVALAQVLGRILGKADGPRWLRLPHCKNPSEGIHVQDMNQSYWALGSSH